MTRFATCKTIEDVKATFKTLCKELHPDNGGSEEAFKDMMNEYKKAFNTYKNIHVNAEGKTYEKATSETAEQFADVITKIIHFTDLTIEIIGSWVWVSGNTFEYKDILKELGYAYSKSKKAWYYTSDKKGNRKGHYSMKQLRERFGSEEIETEEQQKIA